MSNNNLVVSNIAWPNEIETECIEEVRSYGISLLEVAPTKYWPIPSKAQAAEVLKKKEDIEKQGLKIAAAQSLLFGFPELSIFGDAAATNKTLGHLKTVIEICAGLGCKNLVFGSPKNRLKGARTRKEAFADAIRFFNRIADITEEFDVCFCIEANSKFYGCDFVVTTQDAIELVQNINRRGIGLHLDIGNMLLENENVLQSLESGFPIAKHLHISAPSLAPIYELENKLTPDIWELLKKFPHCLSIEMLIKKPAEEVIPELRRSLKFLNEKLGQSK